jgi:hypothetical protein
MSISISLTPSLILPQDCMAKGVWTLTLPNYECRAVTLGCTYSLEGKGRSALAITAIQQCSGHIHNASLIIPPTPMARIELMSIGDIQEDEVIQVSIARQSMYENDESEGTLTIYSLEITSALPRTPLQRLTEEVWKSPDE